MKQKWVTFVYIHRHNPKWELTILFTIPSKKNKIISNKCNQWDEKTFTLKTKKYC
jgi:hypothetical protein